MKVENVHERKVQTNQARAAEVFNSLATKRDQIWPRQNWPAIRLDAPKEQHGRGGHGPIRYRVTQFESGKKLVFTFEDAGLSRGLRGIHFFELEQDDELNFTARHVIQASLHGPALLLWPLVIRPLHDALVEDALDNFERAVSGSVNQTNSYSAYVRLLRGALIKGRSARPAARQRKTAA